MLRLHRLAALVGAVVGAATLAAACGAGVGPSSGGAATGSAAITTERSPIPVVAATNVWGDIAAQIGGSRVQVTSMIDSPTQDPHEFQPSGRDELAVSRAKVVIVNGGGYDDFMDQMLRSLDNRPIVVTAYDVASGVAGFDADNEHLWFNLDAVTAVAQAIDEAFTRADPAAGAEFADATEGFVRSLAPPRERLARIARADAGVPVAVTEPLPLYLTMAAGLDNLMPGAFTDAAEDGIDVAPSAMSDVLGLFDEHRVKLLIYNDQTITAQTQQVLDAAQTHGIPVLPVAEILPVGEHYQQWMDGIVGSMGRLLGEAAAT